MSSISADIPTFKINPNDLEKLIKFIYSHEELLKQFGALKIQLDIDCELALKKRDVFVILDTNNQHITKTDSNEPIYSYQSKVNPDKSNGKSSLSSAIKDEKLFWSNLSRCNNNQHGSNVSILYNKSFFCQRSSRKSFSMYGVPKQSLLKLGGSQIINQFVPYLTKSHGPGANIPLNYTRQHLSSLIYHHCGGARHWYIIPNSEIEDLELLILNENLPVCLNHNQLLIDPVVFDKYGIRYHKIIQYPNEFVILSSGSLSQSFFEDSSWNESIDFALPSWIEEGHALSLCQCNIQDQNLSYQINLDLFQPARIKQYINTNLKIVPQQQQFLTIGDGDENSSLSTDTPTNYGNNSPNVQNYSLPNDDPIISFNKTQSEFNGSSSELISSPISNSSFNQHQQMNIENDNQEQLFEQKETSRLSINASNDLSRNYPNNLSISSPNDLLIDSSNDLPIDSPNDFDLPIDSPNDLSRDAPNDLSINISTDVVNKNNVKRATLNARKTLFVTGLKSNITKNILHSYFVGSTKVTIKKCQTKPHLKYAFILHKTCKHSESNLIRPINHSILGSECAIEYANDRKDEPIQCQPHINKTIVVRKIPENVTENDLKNLFGNCYIQTFCPARCVNQGSRTKTLLGYAFIQYDTDQEIANVMKNADQYKINGSSLFIAPHRNEQ